MTIGEKLRQESEKNQINKNKQKVQELFITVVNDCEKVAKNGKTQMSYNQNPMYCDIKECFNELKQLLEKENIHIYHKADDGFYWDSNEYVISW